MRTKKEIKESTGFTDKARTFGNTVFSQPVDHAILEVLLDIRELLIEQQPLENRQKMQ